MQLYTVQLLLMKEVPKTLDDSLKLACQQETVESVQKQLHRLKRSEAVSATETKVSLLLITVSRLWV